MDNFETKWKEVEQLMLTRFDKLPDMEGLLFLIGINELGQAPLPGTKFSKEQKQDLMHIAVCTLLSQLGYYVLEGRDEDGWPHFIEASQADIKGLQNQEQVLKECMVRYFEV